MSEGTKTRKVQVGNSVFEVPANTPLGEVVEKQADDAGYHSFWVFAQNSKGERKEIKSSAENKPLSEVLTDEGGRVIIEKYNEGGRWLEREKLAKTYVELR